MIANGQPVSSVAQSFGEKLLHKFVCALGKSCHQWQQRGLVAGRQEQTEGRSLQRFFLTSLVAKKAKKEGGNTPEGTLISLISPVASSKKESDEDVTTAEPAAIEDSIFFPAHATNEEIERISTEARLS